MSTGSDSPTETPPQRRALLLRKLHSLTGVAPVGLFLLLHYWTNATALSGREPYDAAVADARQIPFLPVIEIGLILLPLAFHAAMGIRIALEGRWNLGKYPTTRNWMYVLQRVTGIVTLAFLIFHIYEYSYPRWTGALEPADFYPLLCANMSSTISGVPVTAFIYLIGIAATSFHFANGLWGFLSSWGITTTPKAQRISATACGLLGVVLFLVGANLTIYYATGSRLAGFSEPAPARHANANPTCETLGRP